MALSIPEKLKKVYEILEKPFAGEPLTMEETELLWGLEANSPEAFLLRCAGLRRALELSGGVAEIHAQIGLDAGPCVKNCAFCSFAKCNNPAGEMKITPMAAVLDYARAFREAGATPEEVIGLLAASCGWAAPGERISLRGLLPRFSLATIPHQPFVWRSPA